MLLNSNSPDVILSKLDLLILSLSPALILFEIFLRMSHMSLYLRDPYAPFSSVNALHSILRPVTSNPNNQINRSGGASS